jgi:molecular chaperone GrpE
MKEKDFNSYVAEEVSKSEHHDHEATPIPSPLQEEQGDDINDGAAMESAKLISTDEKKYLVAYVQLQADFENFRKRSSREREEWIKMSNRKLIEDLLTILDHLDLAMKSAQPDDEKGKQIIQGFAITVDQFRKLLVQHGLAEMGKLGESFDPKYHEAVGQFAHPTIPLDHICQIIRIGYQLHDVILRPASVIVSSGPAPESQEKGEIL